jgi:hypothetical protein
MDIELDGSRSAGSALIFDRNHLLDDGPKILIPQYVPISDPDLSGGWSGPGVDCRGAADRSPEHVARESKR